MSSSKRSLRLLWLACAGLCVGLLAACTAWSPLRFAPGTPMASVRQALGAPTGEWPGADGGRVLEYATGPFGRSTHLLRFDAQGALLGGEQVLTEANFAQIRAGMSADEVRQRIGRASTTFMVMRPPQTVWAYRYDPPFCQWFMVGMGADGRVMDTAYGPDPMCEVLHDEIAGGAHH